MSKKLTVGKILTIIFCIIAAACVVVLLCVNAYFSGQMKTIDKYLTAIERNDFESYKDCFYLAEKVCTEDNLTAEKNAFVFAKSCSLSAESSVYSKIASYTIDSDKFKAKADFKKRVKIMDGRYVVIFDITLYNETESVKLENISRPLGRDGVKWKIFSLSGSQNLQTITELNENGSAETGGDVLSIVYNGTFSAGDRAAYSLSEENVIAEVNTVGIAANRETTHNGIIISEGTADFDYYYSGWDFKPVSSGECTLMVDTKSGGGGISYSDIYNVTVDENMKITYEVRRVSKFTFMEHYFREKSSTGTVTVTADGTDITFEGEKAEKFRNCLKDLYGAYEKCEPPDIDKLKTVTIKYTSYDNSVQEKFYIGSDRLYYFLGEGNIQWYEFAPDKATMLDGITELLDLKD